MERDKLYRLIDLIDQINRQGWPTVSADMAYGHYTNVSVYDARNGRGDNAATWYCTDDTSYIGDENGRPNPRDARIVTYYDPAFERAEKWLTELVGETKGGTRWTGGITRLKACRNARCLMTKNRDTRP